MTQKDDENEKDELYRTIGRFIIDLQVIQYQIRRIIYELDNIGIKLDSQKDPESHEIMEKWIALWDAYKSNTDSDNRVYSDFGAFILNDESVTSSDANKIFYKLIKQYINSHEVKDIKFSGKNYEFLKRSTFYRNDIAHGYFIPDKDHKYGPYLWNAHRINKSFSIKDNKGLPEKIMAWVDNNIHELDMKNVGSISRKIGNILNHLIKNREKGNNNPSE